MYLFMKDNKRINIMDVIAWLGIWILSLSYSNSRFFIAAMFCPIYIVFSCIVLRLSIVRPIINWCGEYSFELFLGHGLGYGMARMIFGLDNMSGVFAMLVLAFCMLLGCVVLCVSSKIINRYIT